MERMAIACAIGVVGALVLAPPAHADGLGGISGWQPPTAVCGEANVVPLLFGNFTEQAQTVTITVTGNLAEQVTLNPWQSPNCPQRDGTGRWEQNGPNYTQTITVPPGQISAQSIGLGGVDENLLTGNSFTMSGNVEANPGEDIGTWYTFALDLNADDSFVSLQSSYFMTGGIDSTTNDQNGFNILNCSPSIPAAGDSVSIVGPVASPYSMDNIKGPKYGPGEAMCLGWLPEGQFVPVDQVSNVIAETSLNLPMGPSSATWTPVGPSVLSVQAAEYNSTLGTVSMVLDAEEVVAVRAIVNGQSVDLPTTLGAQGGFWWQDQGTDTNYDGTLVIGGIPALPQTQVLVLSGTASQPYASVVTVPTSSTAPGLELTVTMPEDFSVTGSTTTPGLTVQSTVTGQSGVDALVSTEMSFDAQEVASILGAAGSSVATIQLVQAVSPLGVFTTFEQTLGQIAEGAPNSLTTTVRVPVASSLADLEDGQFLTGTYTVEFAIYPGDTASGNPLDYFTTTFTVSLADPPSAIPIA